MSAEPELDGAFRELREFILFLAPNAHGVCAGALRGEGGARARVATVSVERLFAARTYTGSPHRAEARSNQGGTDHAVTDSDWSPLAPRARKLAPP
jgi:hypothetical protein